MHLKLPPPRMPVVLMLLIEAILPIHHRTLRQMLKFRYSTPFHLNCSFPLVFLVVGGATFGFLPDDCGSFELVERNCRIYEEIEVELKR